MRTSKLRNIAWVFFALVLTSSTVFAQGWRNGNRSNYNENGNCLNYISGLTEKQQTQIADMEDKHHEGMDELRVNRRSTANAIENSEIRTKMLKKVEAHRNSVKKVLTADQQKQYDQLHAYGNYGRNQQFANRRCGNGNFARRGNGGGQFVQGNRGGVCYANANFRGKGGNFQNGYGNGNRNYYGNRGNNYQGNNVNYGRGGRNGNFQRGNGRFYQQDSCAVIGSRNISNEVFETIE